MNIYLDTIGCRLNQSEIETFARQFCAAGHMLVASPDQADLVVINTCTVTSQAASDSRQKIRQAARLGAAEIVATGCWATMEPEAAAALPRVSHVITNLDKDHLVASLLPASPSERAETPTTRQPLPGAHQRTRAFIKVQDGCDNRCTYCITCLARGPSRSHSIQAIQQDVAAALAGGALEIVLTGVHLGAWGADLHPASELTNLIQALLADPHLPRLRLSSLEPWDLELRFFALWQDARLCRHLHLPLQSGCAATLRRMARKTTPQAYAQLVQNARAAIPGIAITTDIIVGFPGESEGGICCLPGVHPQHEIRPWARIQLLCPPRYRGCLHARSGSLRAAQSTQPAAAAALCPGRTALPGAVHRSAAARAVGKLAA